MTLWTANDYNVLCTGSLDCNIDLRTLANKTVNIRYDPSIYSGERWKHYNRRTLYCVCYRTLMINGKVFLILVWIKNTWNLMLSVYFLSNGRKKTPYIFVKTMNIIFQWKCHSMRLHSLHRRTPCSFWWHSSVSSSSLR